MELHPKLLNGNTPGHIMKHQ